jgi:hypothetical protein
MEAGRFVTICMLCTWFNLLFHEDIGRGKVAGEFQVEAERGRILAVPGDQFANEIADVLDVLRRFCMDDVSHRVMLRKPFSIAPPGLKPFDS